MGSRIRETIRYLFELYCEVAPGDHGQEPYIINKFPEGYKNEEELKSIPRFTFPCPIDKSFAQHYSYVLTSVDSKYTFCFCRYDPRTNTSLVMLSHLPWHDIFFKLLNSIVQLRNGPAKDELTSFLEACRIRPPLPGHTLKVTYNSGHSVFTCQSPDAKLPSIPDNYNLTEYFSAIDSNCMVALWAAMLHERRIAIVASKPSRLSACVQAANATLFPMTWQHIFIPIVPKHLIDYLLAPMPYIIGVPRSVVETFKMSDIGDIVVLDVDQNRLRTPFRDLDNLPSSLVANLKKELGDKNALGDAVSRAFLRALVLLIGGYRDAIKIENGQVITFNSAAFLKTRKNMQPFLKKILQTQIFHQFIDDRLELLNSGRGFSDEFEVECTNHAERLNSASGQRLKQQYREWAKNVKKEGGAFFKNVKDKANPAVQSAVKSVRQGGKNMKSAVKGLTSKMPKTGSRPSSLNTSDKRNSCGTATPDSSDSSESTAVGRPPRYIPGELPPLDLFAELEYIFSGRRRDSYPDISHSSEQSLADKTKTLSPCPPPRLAERPQLPNRYPIISTRKLVDLSDAPAPPPRFTEINENHFVIEITKNNVRPSKFHTSAIRFAEGNDKPKLKLTMSSGQNKVQMNPQLPSKGSMPIVPPRARPATTLAIRANAQESSTSGSDLIKLEESPSTLEEFDPLKSKDKNQTSDQPKSATDSALLHEYGLDFSRFGFQEFASASSSQDPNPSVPKGWTTFN